MALRVTQHTMYNNMVSHMQKNLSGYMESVQQGSSQKKINRPSDDPAGTYRVLTTRNDMVATEQYQENVDTAKGWLNLADSVLSTNVTTAITGLKTLAQQASNGEWTAQQRQSMAQQAREYFGQLLNLSNTQYEDMHIFAGHKYAGQAFQQGLAATSWDSKWDAAINSGLVKVEGGSESTVLVEFTENGPLYPGMEYKWSNDAGVTWHTDTVKLREPDIDGNVYYQLKPTGSGVTMSVPVDTNENGQMLNGNTPVDRFGYQLDDKGNYVDGTGTIIPFDKKTGTFTVGKAPNENKITLGADGKFTGKNGAEVTIEDNGNFKQNGVELGPAPKQIGYPSVTITNPDYDPAKKDPDKPETHEKISLSVQMALGSDSDDDKEVTETAGAKNGTFIYLRPTAYYQGDDNDPPVDVTLMGAGEIMNGRDAEKNANTPDGKNPVTADGTFGTNILVRIDGAENKNNGKMEDVDLYAPNQDFVWSYSTDGGTTWVEARGKTNGSGTLRLPVPGGHIDYDLRAKDSNGEAVANGKPVNEGKLFAGMQANIHPSRADLDYEILKDTYLSVNSVGKDVFGGYYEGKPAMSDNDYNLFEVVGAFIGYLEGNNQEGCQRTLATLTKAEEKILNEATRIGGMENRVSMAADVLSFQKLDQQERLSYTEDIDLTELLTRLTRQQLTYQTVLQSSSMIMQLSLAKYV